MPAPTAGPEAEADELHQQVISLLRVEAGMQQKALAKLTELQGDLVGKLANSTGLSVNKVAKLNALLEQTNATIDLAYKQLSAEQTADLKDLAKVQGKAAANVVNAGIGASVASVAIAPKTLEALADEKIIRGWSSREWWAGQSKALQDKFGQQMQMGIMQGESVDELVRRVMGTKANGYKDGIMEVSRRDATALVRTSVISVANEAKMRTYREMGDLVKGIQWLATLDTRTTPICRALDKKVWRLPDMEPVGHDKVFPGVTAHWNCRSTQLPVLRTWEELSGKKLPSLDKQELDDAVRKKLAAAGWSEDRVNNAVVNARSSMNGELDAETDWQDWLSSKSDGFVEKLLGPKRAELFKAGKLTISDLTDQQNRPLTIAQLEEALDAGDIPVETTGAPFLPLLTQPAPFSKPIVDALNRAAAKEIALMEEDSAMAKQVAAVKAAEPELDAKDVLAKAQTAQAIAEAAKSKAIKLGMLKGKMVKAELDGPGYILTTKDNELLATLTDEELKAWWASVNDAVEVAQNKAMEKAAGESLKAFAAKSSTHAAAVSAADGKTNVAKMASAQQQLDDLAAEELTKLVQSGSVLDKAVVKGALKDKPMTWDTLTEVKATIAEKKAQAAQTSAITGAKKNWLAGKPFTKVQDDIFLALPEEQQLSLIQEWDDLKAAESAKKAAALVPSITGPDLKVANLDMAPPDLGNATLVKTLPGSTAPQLWKDNTTGKQWVVKSSTELAHLENEARTDAIYRAAGVPVPYSTMTTNAAGKQVKVAEYLDGGENLGSFLAKATPAERARVLGELQQNFVADALLGNWDVAGLSNDNILVVGGKAWRIDNGSGLAYRAQGMKKTADWLTEEVRELKTLLDPSTNPQTAAIFKGVTPTMINQQIVDLLNRRDAILDAAGPSRDYLAKRLAWLEKQLPAGMTAKTAAPGANIELASFVPDSHVKRIKTAGTKGYTYLGDGPDVEDHSVLMWTEKDLDGNPVLKMHLKTTAEGDSKVLAALEAQGVDMKPPAPANPYGYSTPTPAKPAVKAHPTDAYFATIELAAKNVNYHATDGVYNAGKVQAMQNVKTQLEGLMKADKWVDPEAKEMVELYLQHIAAVEKAMAAKTTTQGKLEQYQLKPKPAAPAYVPAPENAFDLAKATFLDGKPMPADVKAWWDALPKQATDKLLENFAASKGVDVEELLSIVPTVAVPPTPKWTVTKGTAWSANVKTMRDGIAHDTGLPNYSPNAGNVVTLERPGVKVQYAAHNVADSHGKAFVGTLEVDVKGDADPGTIAEGMAALRELGLDLAPTSQAQKELLYLHRVVYLRKDHTDAAYSKLWNDKAMDPAAKVDAIKAWAESKYSVKLPRGGATTDYNPDGFDDDSGTGRKFWYRWDMPRHRVEAEMKGYILHHATGNMTAALNGWLTNGGFVTTTYERLRTGVSIDATGGTSAKADVASGGAVHFFNNILPAAKKGPGFVWKIRNLARADLLSVDADTFGAWHAYASRVSTPADWKRLASRSHAGGMKDAGLMKNGINLLEELDEIVVESQAIKQQVLDIFASHGITHLADGRPVTAVVNVK
jgi:SPP1 gp7 family putative phage head morphogenesis protein